MHRVTGTKIGAEPGVVGLQIDGREIDAVEIGQRLRARPAALVEVKWRLRSAGIPI
jgi:hypothetical protein